MEQKHQQKKSERNQPFLKFPCARENCHLSLFYSSRQIHTNGQIYGSQECNCNQKTYFVYCLCGQIIISKEPFFEGQPIKCISKDCSLVFQIVKCSNPQCKKDNFFDQTNPYKMFQLTQCSYCDQKFKQAVCNDCKQSRYFEDGDQIYEGYGFRCYQDKCMKNKNNFHQVITCPNCLFPFLGNNLVPLCRYDCSFCQKVISFMPCQQCSRLIIKNEEFIEGKYYPCDCNHKTQFLICPICPGSNLSFDVKQIPLDSKEKKDQGDFGRKSCFSKSKGEKLHDYIMIKCRNIECKLTIKMKANQESLIFPIACCSNCKQKGFGIVCQHCNHGFECNESCNDLPQIKCPQCHTLNKNDKQTNQQPKLNCSICFDQMPSMFNDNCGHIVVCKECASRLDQQNGLSKCPLCRKFGKLRVAYL